MTIDGYRKTVENQVLITELNMRYITTVSKGPCG